MEERVRQVISMMEAYLHQPPTLEELAGSVNLSSSRLHQLFKVETGHPPARYFRLLRMRETKRLLETTFLSVKQIMARVGATDESHFVRDFKKTHGLTPAKYRQRFLRGRRARAAQAEGAAPRALPREAAQMRSASASATPPIMVRRPSHPRQLADDRAPERRAAKLKDVQSLLSLRHSAFAKITTDISSEIARSMLLSPRELNHLPRPKPATTRRPPPAAQRTPAVVPQPPDSVPGRRAHTPDGTRRRRR